MSIMKALILLFGMSFVWVGGYRTGTPFLFAQSATGTVKSGTVKLNEQQMRGEGLFLQRCSLCHLPSKEKGKSTPSYGPRLAGLFRTEDPDQQEMLREYILKGSDKMPA